jgi:hypothetical protein
VDTLVDTDIIIDFSRGVADAANVFSARAQLGTLFISPITAIELLVGCANRNEQNQIDGLLQQRFTVSPIDATTSLRAIDLVRQYHLSHGLQLADALIAAESLTQNIALLTKNQKHYRYIIGLNLLPYP